MSLGARGFGRCLVVCLDLIHFRHIGLVDVEWRPAAAIASHVLWAPATVHAFLAKGTVVRWQAAWVSVQVPMVEASWTLSAPVTCTSAVSALRRIRLGPCTSHVRMSICHRSRTADHC